VSIIFNYLIPVKVKIYPFFESENKVVPLQAMKVYAEVEVEFHAFFTSASDRSEWPASCCPVSTE